MIKEMELYRLDHIIQTELSMDELLDKYIDFIESIQSLSGGTITKVNEEGEMIGLDATVINPSFKV